LMEVVMDADVDFSEFQEFADKLNQQLEDGDVDGLLETLGTTQKDVLDTLEEE
jgi:hypothetical protein